MLGTLFIKQISEGTIHNLGDLDLYKEFELTAHAIPSIYFYSLHMIKHMLSCLFFLHLSVCHIFI